VSSKGRNKAARQTYIREPTRAEHGTPTAEVRALMSAAGLHERESRMTRSLMGEVFDAVFGKAPV
jgi:hypothetical protein